IGGQSGLRGGKPLPPRDEEVAGLGSVVRAAVHASTVGAATRGKEVLPLPGRTGTPRGGPAGTRVGDGTARRPHRWAATTQWPTGTHSRSSSAPEAGRSAHVVNPWRSSAASPVPRPAPPHSSCSVNPPPRTSRRLHRLLHRLPGHRLPATAPPRHGD